MEIPTDNHKILTFIERASQTGRLRPVRSTSYKEIRASNNSARISQGLSLQSCETREQFCSGTLLVIKYPLSTASNFHPSVKLNRENTTVK